VLIGAGPRQFVRYRDKDPRNLRRANLLLKQGSAASRSDLELLKDSVKRHQEGRPSAWLEASHRRPIGPVATPAEIRASLMDALANPEMEQDQTERAPRIATVLPELLIPLT
jgi:hypothetical protein